jgi:hypothetical protein
MKEILKHRGKIVTDKDVVFIRQMIADNPKASRYKLSVLLCEAWGWVQANGHLRDMVCRGLMLALHRGDHITLPVVRQVSPNPFVKRKMLLPKEQDMDKTPVEGTLATLGPLEFQLVRRTDKEPLFNAMIEKFHYLGYTQPVGEHLKYLVFAGSRPVACFAWSSAPRHLKPRDSYIGWSAEARRRNIRFVAYNSRFLIPPWVEVRYLASHLLGRMVKCLPQDWDKRYGHPVHFAETFIEPPRFTGICYRAANWIYLGKTTGRGKAAPTRKPNRSLKDVLGYPLIKGFRKLLCNQ